MVLGKNFFVHIYKEAFDIECIIEYTEKEKKNKERKRNLNIIVRVVEELLKLRMVSF